MNNKKEKATTTQSSLSVMSSHISNEENFDAKQKLIYEDLKKLMVDEKYQAHQYYYKIILAIIDELEFKDETFCKKVTEDFFGNKKLNEFKSWFRSLKPRTENKVSWKTIQFWLLDKMSNIDKLMNGIEKKLFTSGLLAELFVALYGDDWINVNGKLYYWNGVFWETGEALKIILYKKIDQDLVSYLMEYSNTLNKTSEEEIKLIGKFIINISTIRNKKKREEIIADITTLSIKTNIHLNKNPYLLAFNNVILDLRTGTLKEPPEKDDYITLTTGYDWIEPLKTDEDDLNKIITTIIPNDILRQYMLQVLSTGLSGIQLQNLFIPSGRGGNGKSLLDDLMLSATGNYGYKIPSKLLQEEIKTGANPQVYALNYKRFVLGQEPSAKKQICCSVMKELTGSQTINARDTYGDSSSCQTTLNLTFLLECNDLPDLDEVNEAVERRIRIIPFKSQFVEKEKYEKLKQNPNVFLANPNYLLPEWREKYRCSFIKILIQHFQVFNKNGNKLMELPQEVKVSSANYMKNSDPYFEWFKENYEKKEKQIVYLSDLFENFKGSLYYSQLPKSLQRELTKKKFTEKMENNLFLREYLKLRKEYVDLGEPKNTRLDANGFYGWCVKPPETDKKDMKTDEEDEED